MSCSICTLITFVILVAVWPILKAFYYYYLKKTAFSELNKLKNSGKWAIVTGATDGIGKEFCISLGKIRMNLILISRTQSKLDELSKSLQSDYGVQTKTISCDFTKTDIYPRLTKELESLNDITLLINNVGMSYDHPEFYSSSDEINEEFIGSLLNCNITSMSMMTKIMTRKWEKEGNNSKRYIMNIGSFSGRVPTPLLSLYSGSKSFVYCFSRALSEELVKKNISIQVFSPMFIVSKMSKVKKESLFIPSAKNYAESALNMLGVSPALTGFFWHEIASGYMQLIPEFLLLPKMMEHLNRARNSYLKKNRKNT